MALVPSGAVASETRRHPEGRATAMLDPARRYLAMTTNFLNGSVIFQIDRVPALK